MSFNPDPKKQAQEVVSSRKSETVIHQFFSMTLQWSVQQVRHIQAFTYIHEKLDFNAHIKEKISKAYRGIDIIKKLQSKLPRNALLTIYKFFIRPQLDYADILFDQPTNDSFCKKPESVEYNDVLAITGAIKGTSKVNLYK